MLISLTENIRKEKLLGISSQLAHLLILHFATDFALHMSKDL